MADSYLSSADLLVVLAYMLNATVDSRLAKSRPPLAISSVTAGIMDTFTETVGRGVGSLSKMFDGLPKVNSFIENS